MHQSDPQKIGRIPRRKSLLTSLFVTSGAFFLNFIAVTVFFTSFYGNSCSSDSRKIDECNSSIGSATYLAFVATAVNLVSVLLIAIAADKERKRIKVIV